MQPWTTRADFETCWASGANESPDQHKTMIICCWQLVARCARMSRRLRISMGSCWAMGGGARRFNNVLFHFEFCFNVHHLQRNSGDTFFADICCLHVLGAHRVQHIWEALGVPSEPQRTCADLCVATLAPDIHFSFERPRRFRRIHLPTQQYWIVGASGLCTCRV